MHRLNGWLLTSIHELSASESRKTYLYFNVSRQLLRFAQHRRQQRGLATADLTDHSDERTFLNLEVDAEDQNKTFLGKIMDSWTETEGMQIKEKSKNTPEFKYKAR